MGYAFLQETGAVDEAAVGIRNGEESKVRLRRREALARKTNSDVHCARRDAGFRKVRSQAGETGLADKRPLNIYEELALRKAYLKSKSKRKRRTHQRSCAGGNLTAKFYQQSAQAHTE